MDILAKTYAAITGSAELTEQLVYGKKSIYHLQSPDAGSYPVIVYSVLSDVPALAADNEERERRVTVRVSILTRDGRYGNIYVDVQKAMAALGFVRGNAVEILDKGLKIKVVDYKIGIGVDE